MSSKSQQQNSRVYWLAKWESKTLDVGYSKQHVRKPAWHLPSPGRGMRLSYSTSSHVCTAIMDASLMIALLWSSAPCRPTGATRGPHGPPDQRRLQGGRARQAGGDQRVAGGGWGTGGTAAPPDSGFGWQNPRAPLSCHPILGKRAASGARLATHQLLGRCGPMRVIQTCWWVVLAHSPRTYVAHHPSGI